VTAAATLSRGMRTTPVRLGKPDDLAFVVDSWTKHGHRGERMRTATAHVRALLARPGSMLLVAHVPGEPDSILGWAATEDDCVHYVYVRSAGRRQGTAKALMGAWARDVAEYSRALPAGIVAPRGWTLNLKRSET